MPKYLDGKAIEFIRARYGEGKKTGEIRDLVNERFGLDLKYHNIWNHNPVLVEQKKRCNERIVFLRQAERIARMADTVKQNAGHPKKMYNYSRKDGELARSAILDYIENEPGAHYNKILVALGLNSGLSYHLKRMEDEGAVFSRRNGREVRYYPFRKSEDRVYYSIQENPDISLEELACRLDIGKPTIHYHAEKLVEKGKIIKKRDVYRMRYRLAGEK